MVEGKTLHPKGWRNDLGPIVLSLVRDDHKQPQYFIAVLEDITEKICAERALRDAEHRLTLAQDAAHLGVWDSDLRTNIFTIRGSTPSFTVYRLIALRSRVRSGRI